MRLLGTRVAGFRDVTLLLIRPGDTERGLLPVSYVEIVMFEQDCLLQ